MTCSAPSRARGEVVGEERRQGERRDEGADHVDAEAAAHGHVGGDHEHRDHAHGEVHPLDRADVQHVRGDDDLRAVEHGADGDHVRRELPRARRLRVPAEEEQAEQHRRQRVGGRREEEEEIGEIDGIEPALSPSRAGRSD